jgi:hypothetical protein
VPLLLVQAGRDHLRWRRLQHKFPLIYWSNHFCKLLNLKDLRPLGSAIELSLVSPAFSIIYSRSKNPMRSSWAHLIHIARSSVRHTHICSSLTDLPDNHPLQTILQLATKGLRLDSRIPDLETDYAMKASCVSIQPAVLPHSWLELWGRPK